MSTTPDPVAGKAGQPSLIPGLILLALAAVLIVVVLVNPDMPGWLHYLVAAAAVLVVVLLLIYAVRLFRIAGRGGRR